MARAQKIDQSTILELTADVGLKLAAIEEIPACVQACAESLCAHLAFDLAAFWVHGNSGRGELELQGHSGILSEADVCELTALVKEAIAAAEADEPDVLQSLLSDLIGEWSQTRQHGQALVRVMRFRGKRPGLMAILSQDPLSNQALEKLEPVFSNIAVVVGRRHDWFQLMERNRLLDRFAREVNDVFWVMSSDMERFFYISPSYEKLFGLPVDDLYRNPLDFMRVIAPDDLPKLQEHLNRELAPGGSNVEYRIVRKDGSARDVWVFSFPASDSDGKVVYRCGIAHDITERKEAERRVREFYSVVSHELRTPLTAIRAALGLIECEVLAELPADVADLVYIARSESDRLIRLVNSILDLRHMDIGKLQFARTQVDPGELVHTSIASMRGMAKEANITLTSKIEDERLLWGDRDRLIQVLTNLISNAIKFAPPGTQVAVNVQPSPSDGFIRFAVIDQGPGMPDDALHKLFRPFQQLDSSDSRPHNGSGLGLAISKAIIERIGGTIGVESVVGQGSTFWFDLPASIEQPDCFCEE